MGLGLTLWAMHMEDKHFELVFLSLNLFLSVSSLSLQKR